MVQLVHLCTEKGEGLYACAFNGVFAEFDRMPCGRHLLTDMGRMTRQSHQVLCMYPLPDLLGDWAATNV